MEAVRADYNPPRTESGESPLQLLQVHVFFRHGDRSPTPPLGKPDVELWASRLQEVPQLMPLKQYQYQERPFGHLTKKGAEQTRALGTWIKQAYLEDLHVDVSDPNSFLQVRSTNFLRTHMSAWYVLEGLLGSSELAASVPVCIHEDRYENLYHNDHCPRLAKLWRAAWASKRRTELLQDGTLQETGWCTRFEDIRVTFSRYLKLSPHSRFPWVLAADTAQCALSHGDPLPENVTVEKVLEIRNLLAEDYVSTFQNKEICTLSMGRLLQEVVDAMQQRDGPSMYLYSGHDATLVPLSVSLGLPWGSWPPYAASISIELWKKSSDCSNEQQQEQELLVRVLYDGCEVALPVDAPGIEATWSEAAPLPNENKKSVYSFQEFVRLAGWSMLSDAEYEKKCRSDIGGLEELRLS